MDNNNDLKTWGPTIGRRRMFDDETSQQNESGNDGQNGKSGTSRQATDGPTGLDAFSIGGEFDFLPVEEPPKPTVSVPPKPKEKDELMEALMAVDDEDDAPFSPIPLSEKPKIVVDTDTSLAGNNEGEGHQNLRNQRQLLFHCHRYLVIKHRSSQRRKQAKKQQTPQRPQMRIKIRQKQAQKTNNRLQQRQTAKTLMYR